MLRLWEPFETCDRPVLDFQRLSEGSMAVRSIRAFDECPIRYLDFLIVHNDEKQYSYVFEHMTSSFLLFVYSPV